VSAAGPAPLVRGWEVVIGLETHAQLSTASKMFSGASTRFGAEPNTQACAVDLALPGTLPVPNRGAVERAIRFGLSPTAYARLVLLRHLGADVLMLDEAVSS